MTDHHYRSLIGDVLYRGERVHARNSVTVRMVDTTPITFDGTPLVSCRKTAWKTALREWEWFMTGSENLADLHPSVHPWWKPWADKDGNVRNNYGKQLRRFNGRFDQVAFAIDSLRHHPNSRRAVLTTWNPEEMASPDTPITNCHHSLTQLFVSYGALWMRTYQRSVDVICGLPANWIQSWAFLMWLAHRSGLPVGAMTWIGGDVHAYDAHYDLAVRILKEFPAPGPNLVYSPTSDEFRADDFSLDGPYEPTLTDRAEMIV